MMTVAYLITELERGGAEWSLCRLVGGLDRSRFRPVVFSLTGEGPVAERIREVGAPVWSLDAHRRPVRGLLEFVFRLRELKPSILHTFLFHANVFGRLAGRLAGVPRILASHRVCEEDHPCRAAVERLTRFLSDGATCVSAAVRDYAHRTAGGPLNRLVVIPNGVEIDGDASPAASRPFRLRVLTVARLQRQKGIEDLVASVPDVLRAVPEARFTIVGRGEAGPYRDLARSLGVEEAVRFSGETADVRPFYRDADVFVLPSLWEGCPNAVLEAMASGLPVVATAVGGTPELVVDGVTGRLSAPSDPEALGAALAAILRDPDRARAMGAAGRERAASAFSVRRMVEAHEMLYQRCFSKMTCAPYPARE